MKFFIPLIICIGGSIKASGIDRPTIIDPAASTTGVFISAEQAAELMAPVNTIGVEEADVVFNQLIDEIQEATSSFEQRSQAVLGRVNVTERNTSTLAATPFHNQIRDLYPSDCWSHFTYNCACKTAVPIYRVQQCDRPTLLQITDYLAAGDSYLAFANDQLILKTPRRRSLGLFTQSFDPSSAMISRDWSHGEVPIEARTSFTLKISPRNVTYQTGRGAVRLLPLNHTAINSRLFIITNDLPFEQAADACAAFNCTLAILHGEKQIKEVAIALNKLPGCPSVWFGGVECSEVVSRLFLLFNPVTESAVIDRASRYDASLRNVLCLRSKKH